MLGIYFANLYMSYISESALLSQKKEQSFIPVRSYKISKPMSTPTILGTALSRTVIVVPIVQPLPAWTSVNCMQEKRSIFKKEMHSLQNIRQPEKERKFRQR